MWLDCRVGPTYILLQFLKNFFIFRKLRDFFGFFWPTSNKLLATTPQCKPYKYFLSRRGAKATLIPHYVLLLMFLRVV